MAAGHGGGQDQRRFVLHAQPLDGVVRVREPDAAGAGENAEVDAAAARGAGLDLHRGVGGAEAVEQVA